MICDCPKILNVRKKSTWFNGCGTVLTGPSLFSDSLVQFFGKAPRVKFVHVLGYFFSIKCFFAVGKKAIMMVRSVRI